MCCAEVCAATRCIGKESAFQLGRANGIDIASAAILISLESSGLITTQAASAAAKASAMSAEARSVSCRFLASQIDATR
jgi:hypothetical protein